MHRVKRHCHILFAGAEKAANGNDERNYLTGFIHQNIFDIPDLIFVWIVDVLLIPIRDRPRLLGSAVCMLALGKSVAAKTGEQVINAATTIARCYEAFVPDHPKPRACRGLY